MIDLLSLLPVKFILLQIYCVGLIGPSFIFSGLKV